MNYFKSCLLTGIILTLGMTSCYAEQKIPSGLFNEEQFCPIDIDYDTEVLQKEVERNTKPMKVLYESSTKTYMDYRKITDKTSPQWNLIHSDKIFVNQKGYLQTGDGYIGVAMGSYFGDIGSKYIITLDSGQEINVIKVERKADVHTDSNNFIGSNNWDIIEFVIDTKTSHMKSNIYPNGYIYSGNFNNSTEFNGVIRKIEKVL